MLELKLFRHNYRTPKTSWDKKLSAIRSHNKTAAGELTVGNKFDQSMLGTLKSPHRIILLFVEVRACSE